MSMQDLEDLIKLINSYPADIKAEVLIADLIREGYNAADFLMLFESSFKRGYSNDILKAEKYPVNNLRDVVGIYLARDGLYDLLPEGLFHTLPDAATQGKGVADDSKKEYGIESETRKFFRPIENEFFYHRVQLELQERSILQKLIDNNRDDFFLDFWKIDRSLPPELTSKLCAMLPFVREMAGNFKMTASCLAALLEEEVTYNTDHKTVPYIHSGNKLNDDGCKLGYSCLGIDLITGGQIQETSMLIRFFIGPLKKTGIAAYLEKGAIARFVDCFCSYFIPFEMDAEYTVLLPKESQEFVLGYHDNPSFLGFSTSI